VVEDRSTLAFTIPQSAVQEFQGGFIRLHGGVWALDGRCVLNVLTQSGANGFHGPGFYHLRDQIWAQPIHSDFNPSSVSISLEEE